MKTKIISGILTVVMCTLMCGAVFADDGFVGLNPTPHQITGISSNVNTILGVVQWIGIIVAIGMCIWIGIRYLSSGAAGKAEVKLTMIPWLIGAICVALAPTITKGVFNTFQGGE